MTAMNKLRQQNLANELEEKLTKTYGPTMSNDDLRKVLGFNSMAAFRQALVRNQVPVPVFTIENRHGKFALTKDIAEWLSATREQALQEKERKMI